MERHSSLLRSHHLLLLIFFAAWHRNNNTNTFQQLQQRLLHLAPCCGAKVPSKSCFSWFLCVFRAIFWTDGIGGLFLEDNSGFELSRPIIACQLVLQPGTANHSAQQLVHSQHWEFRLEQFCALSRAGGGNLSTYYWLGCPPLSPQQSLGG